MPAANLMDSLSALLFSYFPTYSAPVIYLDGLSNDYDMERL